MKPERSPFPAPFVPGEALLGAPVLAAMLLTAVNDHWLKAAYPGWITGKLSDFAGLYFFPFLVVALLELARALGGRVLARARASRTRGPSARSFALLLFLEAAVFTALELSPGFSRRLEEAWGAVFGIEASFTPDATDLWALLVLPLAWRTARSRGLLAETRGSVGEGSSVPVRRRLLLPLATLWSGCVTPFRVPGYEGRPIDYVPLESGAERGATERAAERAPQVVRSGDVLIVIYPFRVAWQPYLGRAHHEDTLEGWVWVENRSDVPILIAAPVLVAPVKARVGARLVSMRDRDQWLYPDYLPLWTPEGLQPQSIAAQEGVWMEASIPIEQVAESFELSFAWWEGDEEHALPVRYARLGP